MEQLPSNRNLASKAMTPAMTCGIDCTVLNRARVNEGGGWGTNSQTESREIVKPQIQFGSQRKLSMEKRIEEEVNKQQD